MATWAGAVKGSSFLTNLFPPLWSAGDEIVTAALETIVLAAAATLLGALLCVPVALAASRNLAPGWLRLPVRVLLGVERALPEILTLLFFVVAFGLGLLAGILALAFASVGMLAKLLADSIEEIDPRVREGLDATGATLWQTIRYAILPQIFPALIASVLFRFDVNMRSSVILGAVGAGGIGKEIFRSMGMLQYNRATLAVMASLLLVLAAERVSDALRKRWLTETA